MTQLDALGYAICLEARGFLAEAVELRRLHESNQELLEALDFYGRYILRSKAGDASILTPIDHDCGDRARAAIAKAEKK